MEKVAKAVNSMSTSSDKRESKGSIRFNKNISSLINSKTCELITRSIESAKPINYSGYNHCPSNKETVYITQYHDQKHSERDSEIINCINLNINNPLFDEVLLFTENLNYEDIKDKINILNKVTVVNIKERISYESVFNYIYSNFPQDHSRTYVLSNSDCYFDNSLENIKYIDFNKNNQPLLLTLTRYEELDGSLNIGRNLFVEKWLETEFNGNKKFNKEEYKKLPYLEPWSSDAWIFKINVLDKLNGDFKKLSQKLGTNLCEILFVDELINHNVTCRNVGLAGYIKCIHEHKSLYRKKHDVLNDIKDHIPGIIPDHSNKIFRTKDNSINDCWRLISKNNWLDAPQKEHKYSDFLCLDLNKLFYENMKKIKLLDIHKEKHHLSGWKCVREQFQEQNPNASYFSNSPFTEDSIYLVSFMSEFIINPKINEKGSKFEILKSNPWIGIDHLVNNPGSYYQDMWKGQPHSSLDLINKYKELDLLDNCKALIFMSENQQLHASKFEALNNIPTFGLLHPIVNNNPPPTFDFEIYKMKKREVVQLGWSQRNHSFFNNLPLDPSVFNKYFMFGSRNCYKTQSLTEDLKHHNSTLSCEVLPMLPDDICNQILSQSIVFLNLYDAIANNGILDCIERNTPVIVNRFPSSEEYLGKEYPLFYENSDHPTEEIINLFSDEKILEGHNYLCNLDKSKFDINIFMRSIEKIANIQNE